MNICHIIRFIVSEWDTLKLMFTVSLIATGYSRGTSTSTSSQDSGLSFTAALVGVIKQEPPSSRYTHQHYSEVVGHFLYCDGRSCYWGENIPMDVV